MTKKSELSLVLDEMTLREWGPIRPEIVLGLLKNERIHEALAKSEPWFYQHILEDLFSYNCASQRVPGKQTKEEVKKVIRILAKMMLGVLDSDNEMIIRAITTFISLGAGYSEKPIDILIHAVSNLRLTPRIGDDILIKICETADEAVIDLVMDLPELTCRPEAMRFLFRNENLTEIHFEKLLDRALSRQDNEVIGAIIDRLPTIHSVPILQSIAKRKHPLVHLLLLANPLHTSIKTSIKLIKQTGMYEHFDVFTAHLPFYEKTLSSDEIYELSKKYVQADEELSELNNPEDPGCIFKRPLPKVAEAFWKIYEKSNKNKALLLQIISLLARKNSDVIDRVFGRYFPSNKSIVTSKALIAKVRTAFQAMAIVDFDPSDFDLKLKIIERDDIDSETVEKVYRLSLINQQHEEVIKRLVARKHITETQAEIMRKSAKAANILEK